MSKISKFLAQPQEVTIGGESFMIKPLTVNELPLITRMESKDLEKQAKATQEIISIVMKQIDPEATDEDINQVEIKYLEDIMNAVSKVNNIDVSEAKKKLKENVK